MLALLALTLQLRTVAMASPPQRVSETADSVRDARRARSEQASFERSRRSLLPNESGPSGRCDVRIKRFCWWYDETTPVLPEERSEITRRRDALVTLFDEMAAHHPGDDWLAGMRVHYRIDAHRLASADSVARSCSASRWWCHALLGYAAQVRGDVAGADSAFVSALAEMTEEERCRWNDISVLLPGDARGNYEKLSCADRAPIERRYWMLARPRLAAPANDWRTEFLARRVQGRLAEQSMTPQTVSWGDDAAELLLRYGWPVAWGRVETSSAALADPGIIGHDPSPSWAFGPREALLDTLATSADDGWDLLSRRSETRYAPHGVRRVAQSALQVARFRRGDSILVAAAYAISDDSLVAPRVAVSAALDDGTIVTSPFDSTRLGRALLVMSAAPRLAGVDVADSVSGLLGRSRALFATIPPTTPYALSDVLLYRPSGEPPATLEGALPAAIPGDTVSRSRPLGVFWESYRTGDALDSADVAVTVERIDHSLFRATQQRLGIADEDSPLRMRWTDPRASADVSVHAISLDLANLPAGRYRLTVAIIPPAGDPIVSRRELELIER